MLFRSDFIDGVTNDLGTKSLMRLGMGAYFDFAKPPQLIAKLLTWIADPDALVMDFFAGSGTTAAAVMAQNMKDGGNRRFVLVQLDEACPPDSEAARAGFATISELCRERIRRAGVDLVESAGLTGQGMDIGFRALKLDTTNIADILRTPDELRQGELSLFTDSVKPDRTGGDLLFQVLLDWGLPLTTSIAVEQIAGCKVFLVEDGALIACFDADVSPALVREVAARQPLRAVFRDSGFAADSDRINAEQVFAEVSPMTDVKAI